MAWQARYQPTDPALWQGRKDLPDDACFYQHIKLLDLTRELPVVTQQLSFAVLGFQCDEGIRRDSGRTGASDGPFAIRERLAQLPIQKPAIVCFDVGNIVCSDQNLEASQSALADVISLLLAQNVRPIIIGGGHEVAWGHYQGITLAYPNKKRLGIINFDAHFDLKPVRSGQKGSATTTFYQIAEAHEQAGRYFDYNCIGIQHAGNIRQYFEIAKQFNTKIILADEMHQGLQEKCFDFVDRIIDENDHIYMSLSLDVFANAIAPGVATIQPLGLDPWHIIPLIRQVAASGKVVSYDLAEHAPCYDIANRTAKLAATLIYEIIHHHNENPRTW